MGTLALLSPMAVTAPPRLSFLDALFTSTSAVCVTGLTVITIGERLSTFGQVVLMVLMQVGGLGVMTMSTVFMVLLGRRISLRNRLVLQEELHQDYLTGLVRLARMVAGVAIAVELIGVGLLLWAWLPVLGSGRALYFAVFHAISAFNNAGLDLWGDSLVRFVGNPLVVLTVAGLLIVGGLGFSVIADLLSWHPGRRLQLHTRVAITAAGVLIAGGWLAVALLEWNNPGTLGALPLWQRPLAAFFTAVTPRTAGFNVVPTGNLHAVSLWLLLLFMYVGVSPGSTGGGIKTTTAAVVAGSVVAAVTGAEDLVLFERRLPPSIIQRATALMVLAATWVLVATAVVLQVQPMPPLQVLFEVVSAFGTVGLSTGITPQLSTISRLVIILTMLFGKVGPVTLAMAMARRAGQRGGAHWRFPEERISLG